MKVLQARGIYEIGLGRQDSFDRHTQSLSAIHCRFPLDIDITLEDAVGCRSEGFGGVIKRVDDISGVISKYCVVADIAI